MVLENDNGNKCKPSTCKKVVKNDCLDCDKLQRKVKENEQTVSARDVLIEMSQKEIQKLQNLYKNSIDEYETLRFTYCSVVQDYSNLKDIHKKLEEEYKKLIQERKSSTSNPKDIGNLQTELEYWKNQYEKLQKHKRECVNKEKCSERRAQSDVSNIQNILQSQNQSVKLILSKFLEDLKESKINQRVDKSCQASCGTSRSTTDEGLKKEIDDLNQLVEKLKIENKKIKENLNDKQTHLFKCLNVLEKNHSDIGNLSGHIENICTERDQCLLAIDERDTEICRLKCELNYLKESAIGIEDLRLEKERYYQENKKLKNVIDTFKADTEEKDRIIDEVADEKEGLHKELGRVRRMTVELQEEIAKKPDEEMVEEMRNEIEKLKNEKERCTEELDVLREDLHDKEELVEKMTSTIERDNEQIKKLQYMITHLHVKIEKIEHVQSNYVEEEEQEEEEEDHNDDDKEELEKLKKEYTSLQQEMTSQLEKRNSIEIGLQNKIKELQENVKDLSDTLTIITEENKANLITIENLRKNLNDSRETQEKTECKAKCAIRELQNENEELKVQLKNSQSPHKVSEKIEKVTEYSEPNEELVKLQEKIASLEKSLEEAKLELAEYEEENKAYQQKLESLMNDLAYLREEKLRVEDEGLEKMDKLKQEYSESLSEKDDRIAELQNEINELNGGGDQLATEAEITKLKGMIESIEQEKTLLNSEKSDLISRIGELESELERTCEETDKNISLLQEKIDYLEGNDKEMKRKLECYCDEMNKLETSLKEEIKTRDSNVKDLEIKCIMKETDILKLRNTNLDQAQQIDSLKNMLESCQKRLITCDCGTADAEDVPKMKDELKTKIKDVDDLNEANEQFRIKNEELEDELCKKKCMIISLEKCIDKSNGILGDCEDEIKRINAENLHLRNELEVMQSNLEKLNCEIDIHRADKDILQEKVHQTRRQSEQLEAENSKLLRKTSEDQKSIVEKISVLQQKYNKLLEESEAKDMELEKIKKQFEVLQSCCKSPSITKDEFQKMKKVSREIKELLIEQAKKLNESAENTTKISDEDKRKSFVNKYVSELEEKIKTKENDMKYLEGRNDSMTREILDLKQNVHTLILDNMDLKREIANLLNTVISKVKLITGSGEELRASTSKDTAASGVLKSLIELEKGIAENARPNGCPINNCNCMTVIKARYSSDENGSLLKEADSCVDSCPGKKFICREPTCEAECKQTESKVSTVHPLKESAGMDRNLSDSLLIKPCESTAPCMEPITEAHSNNSRQKVAEPEKDVSPKKKCTMSIDACHECEAECADINETVPCVEEDQDRKE